jgi:PTS system nitrogen regulatory IIA component
MHIGDLLTPARVITDARVSGKKKLLEQLAHLLALDHDSSTEKSLFEALIKREKLGSTGLSHGVAIPHGRSPLLSQAMGCFIRLAEPIDFNAIDGKPVDLVFALIVPEHFTDQHLMFLAQLAELFSNPSVTAQIRSARDAQQIHLLLTQNYGQSISA